MSFVAILGAAVLTLGGGQEPPAQEAPPPAATGQDETPADLGTVVVEGTIRDRANAFVRDIGAPPARRRLARWDRKVCVGVANMERDHAQFMVDRISAMALELGLEVGEPGCGPTVLIVATDNSAELARVLAENHDRMMRPLPGISDRGPRALAAFVESGAPVRWWHVSMPVHVDTGALAMGMMKVRQASRLRANTREQMAFSLILLDVNRIGTVPFGPLSDYVGMISLSQVDPDVDYGSYPTVMNLFATEEHAATLSDWDRDYLASLYHVPGDSMRVTQEARQVADQLVRRQTSELPAVPSD